jgi:hypothetical protein
MWTIEPHSGVNKSFTISNPERELVLEADYDDVDHEQVDAEAKWVIDTLNWAEHNTR